MHSCDEQYETACHFEMEELHESFVHAGVHGARSPKDLNDHHSALLCDLPVDAADGSTFEFADASGRRRDFATFLNDQHVDALVIWSRGAVRQEVYRNGQTFVTWKDAAEGEAGARLRYSLYRSD